MRACCHLRFVLLALLLLLPACRRAKVGPDEGTNEPAIGAVPFTVQVEPALVHLTQGGKARVKVSVTRNTYQGKITLEALNLPTDVTAAPGTVDAGKTSTEMELTASDTAGGSERLDVALVGSSTEPKGLQATSSPFRVSVQGDSLCGENRSLPGHAGAGSPGKAEGTCGSQGLPGPH